MDTIEDVLDKNGFDFEAFAYENEYSAKAIKAAMQEWASLQTPSNEKYEAAEGEITLTRELVYGLIKSMCNYSNHYDNIAFKKIQTFGEYYYEDDEGFDIVLTKLTNDELETILLGFK